MSQFRSKAVMKWWSRASPSQWKIQLRKTSMRPWVRLINCSRPGSQAMRLAWCKTPASQLMEMYSCLLSLTNGSRTCQKIIKILQPSKDASWHSKIRGRGHRCAMICKMTRSKAKMWALKAALIPRWFRTLNNLRALAIIWSGNRNEKRLRHPRPISLNHLTSEVTSANVLVRFNSIHLETVSKIKRYQSLIRIRPMLRLEPVLGRLIAETWLFIIRSISQRKKSFSSSRSNKLMTYTCLMSLLLT